MKKLEKLCKEAESYISPKSKEEILKYISENWDKVQVKASKENDGQLTLIIK